MVSQPLTLTKWHNMNMLETTSVLGPTRPIVIELPGPGGLKTIRVRFASDDEWAGRRLRRCDA